jgi:hypothetical protein
MRKRTDSTSSAAAAAVLSYPLVRIVYSGLDFEWSTLIAAFSFFGIATAMARNLTYILRFYYIKKYSIEVRDPDVPSNQK